MPYTSCSSAMSLISMPTRVSVSVTISAGKAGAIGSTDQTPTVAPTAAEARRFLADKRADKRAHLVDELLERPEFADYQALQWADVLRIDRQALGHKRAYAYYRWLQNSFAQNKPSGLEYDAMNTVSGAAFELDRLMLQNASFHDRITSSSAVDASPGSAIGISR